MTQQEYTDAYKLAEKEISDTKLSSLKENIKAYKLEQLTEQEKWKTKKEEIEEKLRIIKLNLENLDKGNFEAIEERMKKSEVAKMIDTEKRVEKVIQIWREMWPVPTYPRYPEPFITWCGDATSGTFPVGKKIYYF